MTNRELVAVTASESFAAELIAQRGAESYYDCRDMAVEAATDVRHAFAALSEKYGSIASPHLANARRVPIDGA